MTKDQIAAAVKAKGYQWFENGDYNFNLVAVRTSDNDAVTNKFDDFMTLSYKTGGNWMFHSWPITTDPGTYWVKDANGDGNSSGVARVKPGQYKGSHKMGKHKGQYDALVQAKNITVYRDKNKDNKYDETTTTTGIYGINIHHAGTNSENVDKWSAGCQVFKSTADFDAFLNIIKAGFKASGSSSVSLTLIESADLA
ncbi:MAG: hypothetical protein A3D31_09275 [Candidatus Fluviicola riflensis]|nr:MAG: hypothetical protein CHH17_13685 [Candidatus Fluviicola riflensis]OGS77198.1 MAG: hypothetical protein A3D31_09275 [Candidatus Fluviicola riflensis]OGS82133.1 MAG: hypothetical protein A2724_18220 [Fluviicola sp. RIFCSPHIGHO2_01_FULL_43_53]OGS87827.1 MAG: hypothetical protein A3E30_15655 [Fluviicola sp. RIFCSPHIGHO2_12_FULL_43_24]